MLRVHFTFELRVLLQPLGSPLASVTRPTAK